MSSDSKTLKNDKVTETEKSPLSKDEQSLPSSLVRESSSIYSLTLDEFQQTLFDNGKNLGSMNMDEFLNIFTTEEGTNNDPLIQSNNNKSSSPSNRQNPRSETKINPNTQQNLTRQGSLALPTLLSMRTVEEVWSEMNRDQQQFNELENSGNVHSQSTYGEMTLEDFLIKAGVVRENCGGSSSSSQRQMQNLQSNMDPRFGTGSTMSLGFSGNGVSGGGIPAIPQGGLIVEDPQSKSGFQRMWSSGGGYGVGQTLRPVSSGGICVGQVFNSMSQFEVEISGGRRGKKRASEGSTEKVVERRQRRMIKNREAASRSRTRKQAYTVELEAALDKLKQENAHLNQTLLQDKKSKYSRKRMPRIAEELKPLRRMWSLPLVEV